ncbi:MAG TPA: YkgJ family cysteine cluster protein [Armatimonadota bacterium]|nr:YkgJ family cysteine cluster protein [Armatimonadota bacterium]
MDGDQRGQPITVLGTAALLRDESSRRIEGRLQALPQAGEEVSCRAGCHACCSQLVVVSPLEAHAIAEHVGADDELGRRTTARVEAWEAAISCHATLSVRLGQLEAAGGYVSSEDGDAIERDYWAAKLPCPFLDGGRCSIYPVRPHACREHFVLSPPELCAEDLDAVTPANTRLEFRAVASSVGASDFGLPDRLIPLPRALQYARGHLDERAAQAEETEVRRVIADAQRRVRLALARLLAAQTNRRS